MNRVHIGLIVVAALLVVVTIYSQISYEHRAKGEIAFVGDINNTNAGNKVLKGIAGLNTTDVILLGDVCYHGDCSMLEKYQAEFGEKLKCILGNHDIRTFAKETCGQPWSFERDGITVIGLNTQGDLKNQYTFAEKTIKNTTGKIVIATHEPCINSHDNKTPKGLYNLCDGLRSLDQNITFIAGHHHLMALVIQDEIQYYTVGSGGGFLQKCNKNVFTFCSPEHGYLSMDYPKFTFYSKDNEVEYQK